MTADRVVPIPPDVWARMSRHAQDRARRIADRHLRHQAAVADAYAAAVQAEARALLDNLPADDPDECARRAAECVAAVYGNA